MIYLNEKWSYKYIHIEQMGCDVRFPVIYKPMHGKVLFI